MRHSATIGHVLLTSLPILIMLGLLFMQWDTERNILWQFRLHKDLYPGVRSAMSFVTDWGNVTMYIAYLALFIKGYQGNTASKRYFWTFVFFQVAVCFLMVHGTKIAIGRPRPEIMDAAFKSLTLDPLYSSFPSGHTAEITGSCIALALWIRSKTTSIALGLFIALMGLTRIYLNKHFPSDVFFGWMFGLLAASGTFTFGYKDSSTNG